MSTPFAVQIACLWRRGLGAAVALVLSLTCLGFAVAASTMPMAGMFDPVDPVEMADASPTAAPAYAVAAVTVDPPDGVVRGVVREAASPVASVTASRMGSMCGRACVTNVSEMCTVAGGLIVTTLLALLLATRRDTLVALLGRTRPRALRRRQRRRTPWTVLSPISLCVFRV